MQPTHSLGGMTLAVLFGAAVASGACNRGGEQGKVPEVQTQTPPQQVSLPTTVSGCLRAGGASDTFVLTATGTKDHVEPATYHLVGPDGVNLGDYVGKRVEVSGTVSQQQQATGRALDTSAERATGTSGKPEVATTTELDVKRLEVASIKPLGESCRND